MKKLWFDVGIKRYTTSISQRDASYRLWFDVGIKRYTTHVQKGASARSCGLM